MSEQRDKGSPFFKAPEGVWPDIDGAVWTEMVGLREMLEQALDTAAPGRPSPLQLALKLNEIATGIFAQLAPEERDLRQVISTLRTAHCVAWDMYDAVKASHTSVEQYMRDLRDSIDGFEADLSELQTAREGAPG